MTDATDNNRNLRVIAGENKTIIGICKGCEKQFYPMYNDPPEDYCDKCNDDKWAEWEIEEKENLKLIDSLVKDKHSRHCACRIVWGDGECTCDMEKAGYAPYWWKI